MYMKKVFTILILSLLLYQPVMSQQPPMNKVITTTPHQQLTAGLALPLANFGETHYGGITFSYLRKQERFNNREPYQRKKTGWLAAASLSHYLGKKEKNEMIAYRYKGYSLLELSAGGAWYPDNNLDFSLRAGPALGYYNKIFRFTLSSILQGSYKIGPKTVITPGLTLLKETGSDAIWVTSIQLGIMF